MFSAAMMWALFSVEIPISMRPQQNTSQIENVKDKKFILPSCTSKHNTLQKHFKICHIFGIWKSFIPVCQSVTHKYDNIKFDKIQT